MMGMENVNSQTFAELVKGFRTRVGLTQKQFAERMEKSLRSINDWEAGNSRPKTKGDVSEIARIFSLDDDEMTLLLKAAGQDPSPFIWTIPYPRNPYFTGREAILQQITAALRKVQPLTVLSPQAISGLGGSGKTQIALEYAYRFHQEYHAVLWIDASSREAWIASYVILAERLNLPEKDAQEQARTIQAVKRWLQHHPQWLLILDDVDDLTLMRDFLPSLHRGHILLTTRARAIGGLAQCIEVDMMDQEIGTLFLLRRASLLPYDHSLEKAPSADVAGASAICEELGRLPLALDQAGAYLEETQCGLTRYLQHYRARRAALLQRRGGLILDHPEPVATTWSLSFEKIAQQSPAATDLLQLCAFLHGETIPEELILQGSFHLGSRLSPIAADALLFDEMIAILGAYSLIRREVRSRTLSIHRLVQAVLRDAMEKESAELWANRTVQVINQAFPDGEFDTWPQCERLLPHALTCATLIEQEQIATKEAARLLSQTGCYLMDRGRYTEAELILQRTCILCEQVLGATHMLTGCSLGNLAALYQSQGKYALAQSIAQQAIDLLEQVLQGKYTEPTDSVYYLASSLTNLASLYQEQGKYTQAEMLFVRAMALWSHSFGPTHPRLAYALNNLGLLYEEQGQYDDAEALYQQALAISEQILGPNHPHVATCLNNLFGVYSIQKKYIQAEPLVTRALAICERELGPSHPLTATSLNNLALLSLEQGEYAQAESYLQRMLTIHEHVFGPYHSQVAIALNNLANIYAAQEKYIQAESLLKRALSIWEGEQSLRHPDKIHFLVNYALLLRIIKRDEEAEQLERRAKQLQEELQQRKEPQPDQQEQQQFFEAAQWVHHDALDNLERLYHLSEEALTKHLTIQERKTVDRFRQLLWILLDDMADERGEEQKPSLSLAENLRVGQEIEEVLQQAPFVDLEERPSLKHIPGIGYVPDDFPFERVADMAAHSSWSEYALQGFMSYTLLIVFLRQYKYLSLSAKDKASLHKLHEVIEAWRQDWLTGPLPPILYPGPSETAKRLIRILDRELFRKKHREMQQLPFHELITRLHPDDVETVNNFRSGMAARFDTVKDQLIADLKQLGKLPQEDDGP